MRAWPTLTWVDQREQRDLCALFPETSWVDTGHRFVLHGRYVCTARSPECEACPLNEICPSSEADPAGDWKARASRERTIVESRGEAGKEDARS